ncbi:MAG: thiamine diphosphokinase [Ruminococcaceae bacterium]|nr:thiamine diphosphokinase [Oscillospiraceae bacterium]
MRQAVIFCAGELEHPEFYFQLPIKKDALIVCADGGYRHAQALGLVPHMLIGDFDSSEGGLPEIPKMTYPVRKDATDSFLAVDYCLEQGCSELWILGGVGSRWDHSLSNFYLLRYIHQRGGKGILRNENNEVFLISSEVILPKREGWYLSLLPLDGDAKDVTVEGVAYPVENATYYLADSLGVSNQIVEEKAKINVKQGILLGIFSKDLKK